MEIEIPKNNVIKSKAIKKKEKVQKKKDTTFAKLNKIKK